jgi:hypothetical protein
VVEIGILPNLISVNDCDDLCLEVLKLGQVGRSNLERPSYMGIVFLAEPFVQANAVEGRIRRDWLSSGCKCEAEREPDGTQRHIQWFSRPLALPRSMASTITRFEDSAFAQSAARKIPERCASGRSDGPV